MSSANVTLDELIAGVRKSTGSPHRLVLERIAADVLEFGQLAFSFGSAVVLPQPPPRTSADFVPSADADSQRLPLLPTIFAVKAVFDLAREHPNRKILVVGHTDTVGSEQANLRLSEQRAKNVHCLLAGDRDGWARACERHTPLDVQVVLDWATRAHGFGCSPGAIDGVVGPKTERARERFRKRYNSRMSGNLRADVAWGEADWKAVFDLYERSIARVAGVESSELPRARAGLVFYDPPTLACGERWPLINLRIDNLRSAENRRVDVVLVEDKPHPDLARESPPGKSFYSHSLLFRKTVPDTTPDVVELRLLSTDDHPIPEAEYALHLADGSTRRGVLDRVGTAFERGVPDGAVKVEYGPAEDIRARALAARIRYALEEPIQWEDVYSVLTQSTEALERIEKAYAKYHDSLSGEGMRKDILVASDGTDHEKLVDQLLSASEVAALEPAAQTEPLAFAYPPVHEGDGDSGVA